MWMIHPTLWLSVFSDHLPEPCSRPAITPLRLPSHLQSQAHASTSDHVPFPPACSIKELRCNCPSSGWRNTSQHTGCVPSPLAFIPCLPCLDLAVPTGVILFVLPSFLLISMAQREIILLTEAPCLRAIKMECCVLSQLVVTPEAW